MTRRRILLLAAGPLMFVGCAQRGTVRAEPLLPTAEAIVARHDAYIAADESLTEDERRTYLRSGELLLTVLRDAAAADSGE